MRHFGIAILGMVGALAFNVTGARLLSCATRTVTAGMRRKNTTTSPNSVSAFMATIGNGVTTTNTGGANTRGAAIGVLKAFGSNSNNCGGLGGFRRGFHISHQEGCRLRSAPFFPHRSIWYRVQR